LRASASFARASILSAGVSILRLKSALMTPTGPPTRIPPVMILSLSPYYSQTKTVGCAYESGRTGEGEPSFPGATIRLSLLWDHCGRTTKSDSFVGSRWTSLHSTSSTFSFRRAGSLFRKQARPQTLNYKHNSSWDWDDVVVSGAGGCSSIIMQRI
jgi:hypothetical protein